MMRQRHGRMTPRSHTAGPLTPPQLTALVLVFVITAFCLLMLDRDRLLDPLKGPVERPILGLSEKFTDLGHGIAHLGDRFGNTAQLRAENEQLKAENAQLQAAAARVQELERDNAQLVQQANLAQKYPQYKLLPARVVGRDPMSNEKYLMIDRGTAEGVQIGMPALSPDFLVGQVVEVYPHRAKVRLIIDQNSVISVMLQDKDKPAQGIMYGTWQQGGRLEVRYLDRDTTIAPNARFVTSTVTTGIPPGLLVGVATNAKKDVQTDSLTVEVTPLVDFDGLESVTIILTNQQP